MVSDNLFRSSLQYEPATLNINGHLATDNEFKNFIVLQINPNEILYDWNTPGT